MMNNVFSFIIVIVIILSIIYLYNLSIDTEEFKNTDKKIENFDGKGYGGYYQEKVKNYDYNQAYDMLCKSGIGSCANSRSPGDFSSINILSSEHVGKQLDNSKLSFRISPEIGTNYVDIYVGDKNISLTNAIPISKWIENNQTSNDYIRILDTDYIVKIINTSNTVLRGELIGYQKMPYTSIQDISGIEFGVFIPDSEYYKSNQDSIKMNEYAISWSLTDTNKMLIKNDLDHFKDILSDLISSNSFKLSNVMLPDNSPANIPSNIELTFIFERIDIKSKDGYTWVSFNSINNSIFRLPENSTANIMIYISDQSNRQASNQSNRQARDQSNRQASNQSNRQARDQSPTNISIYKTLVNNTVNIESFDNKNPMSSTALATKLLQTVTDLPSGLSSGSLVTSTYLPNILPNIDNDTRNADYEILTANQINILKQEIAAATAGNASLSIPSPSVGLSGSVASADGPYSTGIAPITQTTIYGGNDDLLKRAICFTATLRNTLYNFADLNTLTDIIKGYQYQLASDYRDKSSDAFIKYYTEDAPKMLNFIQNNRSVNMGSSVREFLEVIKSYLLNNKSLLYETRMNGGQLNTLNGVYNIDLDSRLWPISNKFGQIINIPPHILKNQPPSSTNNLGTGLIASETIELKRTPLEDKYQPSFTSRQFCQLNDVEKMPLLQEYCSTSQYANISSLWQYRNFCSSTDVQKLNTVNAYCDKSKPKFRPIPNDYLDIQGYGSIQTPTPAQSSASASASASTPAQSYPWEYPRTFSAPGSVSASKISKNWNEERLDPWAKSYNAQSSAAQSSVAQSSAAQASAAQASVAQSSAAQASVAQSSAAQASVAQASAAQASAAQASVAQSSAAQASAAQASAAKASVAQSSAAPGYNLHSNHWSDNDRKN